MTTFRELAAESGMQPHELAAYLDLGRDYDEAGELPDETLAEYRAILAAGAPDPHSALSEQRAEDDALLRIDRARDQVQAAHDEMHAALRAGAAAGVGERRLADRSGMARATVRKIIGR